MDIEISPDLPMGPPIPDHLHALFEQAEGPPLLAFRIRGHQGLEQEVAWHRHVRGQLICVESGLLTTRTRRGEWSLPPGCAGWMPPGEEHTVSIVGPFEGWGLLASPAAAAHLPDRPCALAIGELVQGLTMRLAEYPIAALQAPRPARLTAVLLDELADAPPRHLHLPMPQDRRLLRIVGRLLAEPATPHGLEHWAHWAGLSARSLSRHFQTETGISFGQWRQQARLAESLRLLHAGQGVGSIAHQLGYSSPSAFVTAFNRQYGTPPGRYQQQVRQPRRPPPALASPAASG